MMVQFWQVSVTVWEVWYRHVKHVFAILHYTENEVILGHNKTWTSKIKNQNGTYVFTEEAKKFIHQLKWEMFCLQNHIPNMNTTKSLHAYLKKDLALTLDHLMIMMYRFVKKTGKNL